MKDGYPITIVDNSEEVVDGMYTKIPSVCLVHLNKDVRYYEDTTIQEYKELVNELKSWKSSNPKKFF